MPTRRSSLRLHLVALASYVLLTAAFNWPLPLQMNSALTASVTGDAGVYVWNQWVFRHELVAHRRFPLFTQEVLAGSSAPRDLSLHNYTLFADLLALPLRAQFGVLTSFNLVYLALTAFTAWAMFMLARSLGLHLAESWLAGVLFAFSPTLLSRSTAHFSLAVAAPLPLFLWAVREGHRRGQWRFAVLAGALAGWAATWDAYYGVFCALAGAVYFAAAYIRIVPSATAAPVTPGHRLLDAFTAALLGITLMIAVTGGTELEALGIVMRLDSLYAPMLAATLALGVRWGSMVLPRLRVTVPPLASLAWVTALWAIGAAVVLLPVLYALGYGLMDGARLHGPVYWRSSPPGVDLLALLLPNPNHAWFGDLSRRWLESRPNGFPENAVSMSLVSCGVMAAAVLRYRWRPARRYTMLALFFGLLSLGPFVHVAGVNTYVPGPWAILRYLPVIGATRTPTRYAIPFVMIAALLFAMALSKIGRLHPRRRSLLLTCVGLALLFELSPFPRPLYPATVPAIYRIVAADPRDVRVMVLPFGFRSGEWSEGSFTSTTQYHQTFHEKAILGGYLSRIGPAEMARQLESANIRYLLSLSEGQALTLGDRATGASRAAGFVIRNRLGYVVMETAAVSPDLRAYATEVFKLEKIAESDGYELYVPRVGGGSVAASP